jgi:hypothetical protein
MNKKVIIIVNGQGGVGKDAFCSEVTQAISFPCKTVSSIDAVKRIARECGWKGEKTDAARKFLSDLKRALSDYSDLPFKDMMREAEAFRRNDEYRILFVHIREPEEIEKFKKAAGEICRCVTLLITRPQSERPFGNTADDNVKNYSYDFTFVNNYENLQLLAENAVPFIQKILES